MKCKDCTNYACPERSNGEMVCIFQQRTAKEPFDWQSFRAEAAKDILCAIIQSGYYGEDRIAHQSELAVGYANELCKQLKEKEQKKLTWEEVKYIIELDGNIETDNFMGSDEYYQAIADKANVVLFGLQGKLD